MGSQGQDSSLRRPALSYVVNSLDPGGTERLVVEMSLAFCEEYAVHVLCLDEPGSWAAHLRRRGVPVHGLRRQPGLDLSTAWRLAHHFRRHGTRIIHAHQCTPWFYSALARLRHPQPRLLFQEHGRFYPEVENRKRVLINRLLVRKLTHRCVAVSQDIRTRLVRYEGLAQADVEVLYNGVRTEPQLDSDRRAALRRQLGFAPDDFVVGTVGRFDPVKNLPMLIEGLERAGGAATSLQALLVGDGPMIDDIRARVEQSPMRQRIRLTGYRDDARDLVQCMDLFLLPSFSEGTSVALLEAMAGGVPAAVTEVGGNPEIVLQGETGWTVPSGSVDALAAAILDAVGDPDRRRRYALAGRRRFEAHFSMEQMIEAYRQRYLELGARGG